MGQEWYKKRRGVFGCKWYKRRNEC